MSVFEKLEAEIQGKLSDESLRFEGEISGGIVNKAALFTSQQTTQSYFVKYNPESVARRLFETESYSLHTLAKTGCVTVPSSIRVFSCEDSPGAVHVLEYLPGLSPLSDYWSQFGKQIGRLHTLNAELVRQAQKRSECVHQSGHSEGLAPTEKFGGTQEYFMGTFTPGAGWRNSWQELLIGDLLDPLISGVVEKFRDTALHEKWTWLQRHVHKVFEGTTIVPSINHGDLCVANCGQTQQGPVVFDPQVWYSHSQLDLIIPHCEQPFDGKFYEEYHGIVPRGPSWDQCMTVYEFLYNVVTLYHVDDEKIKVATHTKAGEVKEMLCRQFNCT